MATALGTMLQLRDGSMCGAALRGNCTELLSPKWSGSARVHAKLNDTMPWSENVLACWNSNGSRGINVTMISHPCPVVGGELLKVIDRCQDTNSNTVKYVSSVPLIHGT